jgi:hypothetical protein
MKEGRLQDLDLEEGDVLVCVNNMRYFVVGDNYTVKKDVKGFYLLDKDGYMMRTTTSIFKFKQHKLRNVKIDLRKPDGTVDEEKSAAFQEAVFEGGGKWCYSHSVEAKKTKKRCPFIYVSCDGDLLFTDSESAFNENHCTHKEVNFNYIRKLEYTIELVKNKEKTELEKAIIDTQNQLKILTEKLEGLK